MNWLLSTDAFAQVVTATATLTWTAPGDDGFSGRAYRYDFRYSAKPIVGADTLAWWNTAAVINMSGYIPASAGMKDSVKISGLVVGVKYYAILRAADEVLNWSSFSNIAIINVGGGTTAVGSDEGPGTPRLVVGAPFPSPTSGQAQLAVELARPGPLSAEVFDAHGRAVRSLHSGPMSAGRHVLRWDCDLTNGSRAAAGVYWIRVAADNLRRTVKLVVVR